MSFFLQVLFVSAAVLAVPSLCYLLGRRFAPRVFRRLAYEVHLWLGVVSAPILFVVCLSGTLLTFKPETLQWVDRHLYYVNVPTEANTPAKPLPIAELIPKVEKDVLAGNDELEKAQVIRVTIPEGTDRSWIFNVRETKKDQADNRSGEQARPDGPPASARPSPEGKPSDPPPGGPSGKPSGKPRGASSGMPAMHAMLGTAYLVDPYTGELLGAQTTPTAKAFIICYGLHRFLLIPGDTGRMIVGAATLVFLVLILGGLFLWIPAKLRSAPAWKIGLRIRLREGGRKFAYDIHNTLGFYALIPLLVMALTGPVISFPWYNKGVARVLGTRPFDAVMQDPPASQAPTPLPPTTRPDGLPESAPGSFSQQKPSWEDFLAKADELSDRKGETRLYLPASQLLLPPHQAPVSVRKIGAGFCTVAATDIVYFDQYSGEVLRTHLFDEYGFGEKIANLIFPLHNGEIFGTVSKIVYFFACLVATSLPLTGLILWIGKLRARRKARKQRARLQRQDRASSENAGLLPGENHAARDVPVTEPRRHSSKSADEPSVRPSPSPQQGNLSQN